MFKFEPKSLNGIKEQLFGSIPLPEDYALSDDTFALDIINDIRGSSGGGFESLSPSELKYAFSLAKMCSDEELARLKAVFFIRMQTALFDIGWVYCQINPNEKKATELFMVACEWMKVNKQEEFNKTLFGRTGLVWDDIYTRCVEIIKVEKLANEDFCEKFKLIKNSLFCEQIQLAYFARCERDELVQRETQFANLILNSKIEFLRPALINYTAKINYDDMAASVNDAILFRLSNESNGTDIGLSPSMLLRIRQQRFNTILENCCNGGSQKSRVYTSVAGKIRGIELLTMGFFTIDFGSYIVLDNSDWVYNSFAYTPEVYKRLYEGWKETDFNEEYWPGVPDGDIVSAKDLIFKTAKGVIIKLDFNDFNMLYTKDLLGNTR